MDGQPFPHMLYHFMMPYSRWERRQGKMAVSTFGVGRCFEGTKGYEVAIAAYKNALKFATAAGAEELRAEILREHTVLLEHTRDPDLEKYEKECAEANKKFFPKFVDKKPPSGKGKTSK